MEPLSWRERGWLWARLGIRIGIFLIVVRVFSRHGRQLLSLFGPFLAALIVAVLMDPLIRRIQRRIGWSRGVVTLLVLLVLLALVGGGVGALIYVAGKELMSLTEHWDDLLLTARNLVSQLDQTLSGFSSMLPIPLEAPDRTLLDRLMDLLTTFSPDWGGLLSVAGDKVRSVSSFLLALVFFLMASYLLTADFPYLRSRAAQNMSSGMLDFLRDLHTIALGAFGGYLRAELLLTGGVFCILLGGFLITRQPYGLLLAAALALLDFIPVVGAGTVMVPWAVISLVTGNFPGALRLIVIWGLIVMFRRMAEPKFLGDQTGLSPLLSLFSIYVGMKIAGVPGMILCPILFLIVLNLAGMGMFRGLRLDVEAAWRDLSAILSRRPGEG